MSTELPGSHATDGDREADDDREGAALHAELMELRARVARLKSELAGRKETRLGRIARIARSAVGDPVRRRTLFRDLSRAIINPRLSSSRNLTSAANRAARLPLPALELPAGPSARPDLTAAVILDPFSELALCYEWNQITFGPDDWRETLASNMPDLLFVESAWQGNGRRWRLHMTRSSGPSDDLRELVAWCRGRGIPTVFWNKEDPPNYERFIATAKLFDYVFTVDADRISAYYHDLEHERVGLLPFAAQPRIHNPIQRGPGRIYDLAFAGTYFSEKYPQRKAQMDYVLGTAAEFGLHIYSRMVTEDQRYQFPKNYQPHVVGSLPYEQMLAAYTSYRVFLNVNSVTESETMCSRRLFELSAAQTAVVSSPAASIEPFFGDTLSVVRDADETRQLLPELLRQDEYRDRLALRAHRLVFDRHLYGHRVDTVLETVGLPVRSHVPSVSAVVASNRPEQLESVLTFVGRQDHSGVQLVLVTHGFDPVGDVVQRAKEAGVEDVVIRTAEADKTLGACMNLGVEAADGMYVAKMDDDNWYGTHYLSDLVRAFSYTNATVVGKWAHFVFHEGSRSTLLRFSDHEHRYVDLVQGGTIMVATDAARDLQFEDLPRRVDTTFLETVRAAGGSVYSSDRFNFVSVRRAEPAQHTWKITEADMLSGEAKVLFYGEPFVHAQA